MTIQPAGHFSAKISSVSTLLFLNSDITGQKELLARFRGDSMNP